MEKVCSILHSIEFFPQHPASQHFCMLCAYGRHFLIRLRGLPIWHTCKLTAVMDTEMGLTRNKIEKNYSGREDIWYFQIWQEIFVFDSWLEFEMTFNFFFGYSDHKVSINYISLAHFQSIQHIISTNHETTEQTENKFVVSVTATDAHEST